MFRFASFLILSASLYVAAPLHAATPTDPFADHARLMVEAINQGDPRRVGQLLKTPYVDANDTPPGHSQPYMFIAVYSQSANIARVVQVLLENGADVNHEHCDHNDDCYTPLGAAITLDRMDVGVTLIRSGKIDGSIGSLAATAVYRGGARRFEWLDMVLALPGIDVNRMYQRKYMYSPIFVLSWRSEDALPAIHRLLTAGADPNSVCRIPCNDRYPIHMLARHVTKDSLSIVKLMVMNSAALNARDGYGYTPVDYTRTMPCLGREWAAKNLPNIPTEEISRRRELESYLLSVGGVGSVNAEDQNAMPNPGCSAKP